MRERRCKNGVLVLILLLCVSCDHSSRKGAVQNAFVVDSPRIARQEVSRSAVRTPVTTTTVAPTTTTTIKRHITITKTINTAPRSQLGTGGDFWRRLANCESADGHSGTYIGYFQFSRDTAKKVGITGSESYDTQVAAAQKWASIIHPREGTTAGWPHCWWVALRG